MDSSALFARLNNLENSWSSLDSWLKFWIALVVIGVAIELVVVVKEYRDDKHEWGRGIIRPPDRPSRWLLFWNFLGAGLVAIGVAGEFAIHLKAGKVETDMRDTTRQLVAIVDKDAGEAKKKAGDANREAAQLRKDAEGLKKQAEDEKTARVALQKQLAWREPTDAQLSRIRDRLLAFRDQQFDVVTYPSEPECLNLANRVYSVAIVSQWVLDPERKFAALFSLLSGIQINVSEQSTQRTKDAATTFVDALSREGLSATVKIVGASDSPPRAGLLVVEIGRNPASMTPVSLPQ
jgi:hypothetical protein